MNDLTYFTVTGEYQAVVADESGDPDYNPNINPITAIITFTPLLLSGDVIRASHATPPTLFVPSPIVGIVDADGKVKLRPEPDENGQGQWAPIRLLADQPKLELKEPLAYRVSFTNVRFGGRPGVIKDFTFEAPNTDCVLDLTTVTRAPSAQPATGITKIAPGRVRLNDAGELVFSFDGRDIPDPIPLSQVIADALGRVREAE